MERLAVIAAAEALPPACSEEQVAVLFSQERLEGACYLEHLDGSFATIGRETDAIPTGKRRCPEQHTVCITRVHADDPRIRSRQLSREMFNPWYMTASRPVITNSSDHILNDGSTITVQIGNSEGASISRVALMRAGSATHAFDGDQRLIWLTKQSQTASQVVVSAPNGAAAAPPGDYMLFVLKNGPEPNGIKRFIPSVGRWVRVNNPTTTQILPANYDTTINDAAFIGLRPAAVDAFDEGGVVKLNIVYTRNDAVQWFTKANMTAAQFVTELNAHPAPFRLVSLDSYQLSASDVRYVAVWNTSAAPAGAVTQRWHDVTLATHNANVATFEAQGYRLVAVSTVMVSGTPRYTAFMDKAAVGTKATFLAQTEAQVAALVTSQAPKRLAYISAYMEGATAKFNVIFNSFDAGVNPNAKDPSNALLKAYALGQVGLVGFVTAQGQRMQQGYSLRQLAGYQVGGVTRYSGVWSLRPQL
ncbi:MAG TPA: galactose oxidase-like domain-containing protein [Polyangiaceae bacterium]